MNDIACSSGIANALRVLGNAAPTVNAEDRQIKGYMVDEDGELTKTYFNSTDLRQLASNCVELADWLDRRAGSDGR